MFEKWWKMFVIWCNLIVKWWTFLEMFLFLDIFVLLWWHAVRFNWKSFQKLFFDFFYFSSSLVDVKKQRDNFYNSSFLTWKLNQHVRTNLHLSTRINMKNFFSSFQLFVGPTLKCTNLVNWAEVGKWKWC